MRGRIRHSPSFCLVVASISRSTTAQAAAHLAPRSDAVHVATRSERALFFLAGWTSLRHPPKDPLPPPRAVLTKESPQRLLKLRLPRQAAAAPSSPYCRSSPYMYCLSCHSGPSYCPSYCPSYSYSPSCSSCSSSPLRIIYGHNATSVSFEAFALST